jgi:hypothetical protein
MRLLPSEIPFASFLQYTPRGDSEACKRGRRYRDAIKNDGPLFFRNASGAIDTVRGIEFFIQQIASNMSRISEFKDVLGPDTILVPIPRSAPLASPRALWPARRICEALIAQKLGADVLSLLRRHTAVRKSATASAGFRPDPIDHFNSTSVDDSFPLLVQGKITLVDDFITRGSTFLGMYPHVKQAYSDREISCFALVRTMSFEEVAQHYKPVQGIIENRHGKAWRTP